MIRADGVDQLKVGELHSLIRLEAAFARCQTKLHINTNHVTPQHFIGKSCLLLINSRNKSRLQNLYALAKVKSRQRAFIL